jgi:hypothetical protein
VRRQSRCWRWGVRLYLDVPEPGRAAGFRYVKPPTRSTWQSADSARYATASVRVLGRTRATPSRSPVVRFSSPSRSRAPHRIPSWRHFVAFLVSEDGRRILRATHFDALDRAAFVGNGVPAVLTQDTSGR